MIIKDWKLEKTAKREITEADRFRLPFLNLNLLVENAYLAGGSCIILFDHNHKFNDYDIFLLSAEAYELQRKKLVDSGFIETQISKYSVTFINNKLRIKVQVIRWDGVSKNIEDIIMNFDIDACRIGTDGKILYHTPESQTAISLKEIGPLINIKNSGWALKRLQKYETNGYNIRLAVSSLFDWIRSTKREEDEFDPDEEYTSMGEVVF